MKQEDPWLIWNRWDDSPYEPPPAMWLRALDRSCVQAAREFGHLAGHGPHLMDESGHWVDLDKFLTAEEIAGLPDGRNTVAYWKLMQGWLRPVAELWRPSRADPAVYCLSRFNPIQHAGVVRLKELLEGAHLVTRRDGLRVRIVPQDLSSYLVMTCAADVADQTRFVRCRHCNEWSSIRRADNRFCSNACRQADYLARKAA